MLYPFHLPRDQWGEKGVPLPSSLPSSSPLASTSPLFSVGTTTQLQIPTESIIAPTSKVGEKDEDPMAGSSSHPPRQGSEHPEEKRWDSEMKAGSCIFAEDCPSSHVSPLCQEDSKERERVKEGCSSTHHKGTALPFMFWSSSGHPPSGPCSAPVLTCDGSNDHADIQEHCDGSEKETLLDEVETKCSAALVAGPATIPASTSERDYGYVRELVLPRKFHKVIWLAVKDIVVIVNNEEIRMKLSSDQLKCYMKLPQYLQYYEEPLRKCKQDIETTRSEAWTVNKNRKIGMISHTSTTRGMSMLSPVTRQVAELQPDVHAEEEKREGVNEEEEEDDIFVMKNMNYRRCQQLRFLDDDEEDEDEEEDDE